MKKNKKDKRHLKDLGMGHTFGAGRGTVVMRDKRQRRPKDRLRKEVRDYL